jgi:hypothetical protein
MLRQRASVSAGNRNNDSRDVNGDDPESMSDNIIINIVHACTNMDDPMSTARMGEKIAHERIGI